jgi:hypothetical protein
VVTQHQCTPMASPQCAPHVTPMGPQCSPWHPHGSPVHPHGIPMAPQWVPIASPWPPPNGCGRLSKYRHVAPPGGSIAHDFHEWGHQRPQGITKEAQDGLRDSQGIPNGDKVGTKDARRSPMASQRDPKHFLVVPQATPCGTSIHLVELYIAAAELSAVPGELQRAPYIDTCINTYMHTDIHTICDTLLYPMCRTIQLNMHTHTHTHTL